MNKNILLIGLGGFGKRLAQKFHENGQQVMAIDVDEEKVNDCLQEVTNAVIGNSTREEFMESLGVSDYDICIVAIGDDFQSSLETTALLKDLGAKLVVARAASEVQERLLLRIGADRVIFPEKLLAEWTAVRYGSDHIFDYFAMDSQYALIEMELPPKWEGHTVVDLNVRQKYGINIIATKRNGVLQPSVDPNAPFTKDVRLLVLGKNDEIQKCFR